MAQQRDQNMAAKTATTSLVVKMAERYAVDADKLLNTLKQTAFQQKEGTTITNEQMMALLVVADQYQLNPFTREIYAYPDKNNGIVPVVGIDGWSRIINSHQQFDGLELGFSENLVKLDGMKVSCPEWIDVSLYRKDRTKPTIIREYLDEVYKPPFKRSGQNGSYTIDGPWQTHPKRFLRHKGIIQCARIALGYTGIYERDEADRIIDMGEAVVVSSGQTAPTLMLSNEETQHVDTLLNKVIEQAKQLNAWAPAHEWLKGRFSGPAFAYASTRLSDEEAKVISNSFVSEPDAELQADPSNDQHQQDLLSTSNLDDQRI